ncbi:Hsp33 family molecular chaperone HslO [Pseudaquidulcibacter saccharophilus]|uniref:Hsp33 family molecular chaperone HslO n=1 Tax=Pseudaquidulcibacter saccharophilus TaxID=2831900 RepID=UPI001EFF4408|nr:Hsp33 family molecular chaperone HslO [Pseudaquidulcibacter saccharophilus]
MDDASHDIFINSDDIAFSFVFEGAAVRGELVRLGPATADDIITRHALPDELGRLLGEMLALSALCGASLKFNGRMIVELRAEYQNEETPLEFIVAEFNTDGTLRGMVKRRPVFYDEFSHSGLPHTLPNLFGMGILLITIDQGAGMERYQGQVAIEADSIAELAETYFMQSEQIPSKIILAARKSDDKHAEWSSYGFMIQRVAADITRGVTEDLWDEAVMKFETLSPDELLDREIAPGEILHRLYHENEIVVFKPKYLLARCTCNREKLVLLMSQMPKEDTEFLIENDGQIHARCEFCNTTYHIDPSELKAR